MVLAAAGGRGLMDPITTLAQLQQLRRHLPALEAHQQFPSPPADGGLVPEEGHMIKISVRQPLLLRAGAALVGMGVVRLAAWAGWIPDEWANIDQAQIEQFIDLAILGISWRSTHKAVTPVANPRANDGTPLVPLRPRPRPL